MKDFIIFIHAKFHSTRVPYKNLQLVGGVSLLRRAVLKAVQVNADVFVDSDNQLVLDQVSDLCETILRPSEMGTNDTDGNDLLGWAIDTNPGYSKYLQVSCCSPFLRVSTIQDCINALDIGPNVLTMQKRTEYVWDSSHVPQYDIDKLPNSFDKAPYFIETHGVYGVCDYWWQEEKRRASRGAIFVLTEGMFEEFDINTLQDLEKAKRIAECFKL